jgi:hypothetical protein
MSESFESFVKNPQYEISRKSAARNFTKIRSTKFHENTQYEISRKSAVRNFTKIRSTKFHENPSCEIRIVACGKKDRYHETIINTRLLNGGPKCNAILSSLQQFYRCFSSAATNTTNTIQCITCLLLTSLSSTTYVCFCSKLTWYQNGKHSQNIRSWKHSVVS